MAQKQTRPQVNKFKRIKANQLNPKNTTDSLFLKSKPRFVRKFKVYKTREQINKNTKLPNRLLNLSNITTSITRITLRFKNILALFTLKRKPPLRPTPKPSIAINKLKPKKKSSSTLTLGYWKLIRNLKPVLSRVEGLVIRNSVFRKHVILPIIITASLTAFSIYWYILKDLPSPTKLSTNPYPVSTLIYDRNGTILYEIFADQNRIPVQLNQLPDYLKQATIAIEDKDFYQHHGLSATGILRAAWKNFNFTICQLTTKNCQINFQGGSTITQQLIKNTLLTPQRSLQRKLKEALLTFIVETKYTKDQILEMYLNQVPYGGTAYGIESAAQTYFSKPATQLTLAEATILAGLPQAPSRYSPYSHDPQAYKIRQQTVLRRMIEDGYLTQKQADQTVQTEVEFAPQANLIHAPHFVLWIKDLLVEKYGQQIVEQGGLRVTTTLDLELQQFAQETVASEIAKLKSYQVTNGAALITQPATGQILAMVGSADYSNLQIN